MSKKELATFKAIVEVQNGAVEMGEAKYHTGNEYNLLVCVLELAALRQLYKIVESISCFD